MTVKLKVIDIRPCLPGVINASVSEYSSMIFLMYKCTIALLGDHPPPPPLLQPSQLIHLVVSETATIFHGGIEDKACGKTL